MDYWPVLPYFYQVIIQGNCLYLINMQPKTMFPLYTKLFGVQLLQKAHICVLGTIAYILDDEALLIRVSGGWQYVAVSSRFNYYLYLNLEFCSFQMVFPLGVCIVIFFLQTYITGNPQLQEKVLKMSVQLVFHI